MKAFPVAVCALAPPELSVPQDDWEAFNLPPHAAIELLCRWEEWLAAQPPQERRDWAAALHRERLESLGLVNFFARHPHLKSPVVLAPASAHYSWPKGLKLTGLGATQLVSLRQRGLRIDIDALEDTLTQLQAARQPVLMAVAMLGTTEFGAVDPIDGLLAVRERCAACGFGFGVHVDAAWGGYGHAVSRTRRLAAIARQRRHGVQAVPVINRACRRRRARADGLRND